MQYNVKNITDDERCYNFIDYDFDDIFELVCLDFILTNIPTVYEYSDEVKIIRKQFKNELDYSTGYKYIDRHSGNTYLINSVSDVSTIKVKNVLRIIEDYLHARPVFLKPINSDECQLDLSYHINKDFNLVDNLVDLLINNVITLSISNISVFSEVVFNNTKCAMNLYKFIELVKINYYGNTM